MIDGNEFFDINKNIKKYGKKLYKILSKKYKTLYMVEEERAGHIILKFKGTKENVENNMAEIIRYLIVNGNMSQSDIYNFSTIDYGDFTLGMIESNTISVLSEFYKELKK